MWSSQWKAELQYVNEDRNTQSYQVSSNFTVGVTKNWDLGEVHAPNREEAINVVQDALNTVHKSLVAHILI